MGGAQRSGLWDLLSPAVLVAGPEKALDVAERERLAQALRVKAQLAAGQRAFEAQWRELVGGEPPRSRGFTAYD